MKLTQEEYKKLKEDELISTNIWFLKEYLSELSPIIIIRLFHIVVNKKQDFYYIQLCSNVFRLGFICETYKNFKVKLFCYSYGYGC